MRNLPHSTGENIVSKVNGVLRDGLRLRDVSIKSAERKQSRKENDPGVVIVKCNNIDDKKTILSSKRKLKDSRNFRDVFIHNDYSQQERIQTANLRTLIKAVGNDNLIIKGNRVQFKRTRTEGDTRDVSSNSNENAQHPDRDSSHASRRQDRNRRFSGKHYNGSRKNDSRGRQH